MAKLVILSQGQTGRSHELTVDKTTIGRVEDNTFQIAEPSVSSHHCEVLLKGSDILIRDLNSTNGTFINGEKTTEAILKPGQILRLGQIEMRLETEGAASNPGSAAAAGATAKKTTDGTMVMQRGVSLTDLEAGARGGFDTATKGFSKKDNKANKIFIIAAVVVIVIVAALVLIAILTAKST